MRRCTTHEEAVQDEGDISTIYKVNNADYKT